LFAADGTLLGRGTTGASRTTTRPCTGDRRVPQRGRRRSYRDTIMVTTLAPCWYCSGLVRQFGIGTGRDRESRTFQGGDDWLREAGVTVIDLDSDACFELLQAFIAEHPEIWTRTIGE
jgi:cytosine deaminase